MMRHLIMSVVAVMGTTTSAACSSGTPETQPAEARPPSRDAILRQAIACGFHAENLVFSVDEDGVDNAVISPIGPPDERFRESVDCMMAWAAETGAALGFEFEPRRP